MVAKYREKFFTTQNIKAITLEGFLGIRFAMAIILNIPLIYLKSLQPFPTCIADLINGQHSLLVKTSLCCQSSLEMYLTVPH